MIKEFEFYHGAVLAALVHRSAAPIKLLSFPTSSNASYILNDNTGLYIKHSSKRMSPWIFTMQVLHVKEILQMKKALDRVFVLLVCGEDGAVTLSHEETFSLISAGARTSEWISATRSPRSEYTVKGSQGMLKYKIGKNDLFKRILINEQSIKRTPVG